MVDDKMNARHREIEGLKHLEAAAQLRRRSLMGVSASFYDDRMRAEKEHIPTYLQPKYTSIVREKNEAKLSDEINHIKGQLRNLGYDHANMATIEKFRRAPARTMTRRRSTSRSKLFERAHGNKYDYSNGKRRSKSVMRQQAEKKKEKKRTMIMKERIRTEIQAEARRKKQTESLKNKAKQLVKQAHDNLQTPEPEVYAVEPTSPPPTSKSARLLDMDDIDDDEDTSRDSQDDDDDDMETNSPLAEDEAFKEPSLLKKEATSYRKPESNRTRRPYSAARILSAAAPQRDVCVSPKSPAQNYYWKPNYAPSLTADEQQLLYESTRAEAEQYRIRQSSSRLFGPDPSKDCQAKAITLNTVYNQMASKRHVAFDDQEVSSDSDESMDSEPNTPQPIEDLPMPSPKKEHKKAPIRHRELQLREAIPSFQPAAPLEPSSENGFTQLLAQFHDRCASADAAYQEAISLERIRYERQLVALQDEFQKALQSLN